MRCIMSNTEEREFLNVVEKVLKKEQISLSKLCISREGCSYFDNSGLATRRMENALVYLICKKLLDEKGFFYKWSLAWEDNYPRKTKQHCDITMTRHKPSPGKDRGDLTKNPGPWHFIEFGYYSDGALQKYARRLKELEDQKPRKEVDSFKCGGRYIVMFRVVSEGEARQLEKAPIRNNYLNDGDRKKWVLKRSEDIRKVSLDKENGVFVIEFFKLAKHRGAS